jgi:hypothetical protein
VPGERSGRWQLEVAENGMMTEELFLKVDLGKVEGEKLFAQFLGTLATYLDRRQTPRPVIAVMDGASCHLSIGNRRSMRVDIYKVHVRIG